MNPNQLLGFTVRCRRAGSESGFQNSHEMNNYKLKIEITH